MTEVEAVREEEGWVLGKVWEEQLWVVGEMEVVEERAWGKYDIKNSVFV